MKRVVNAWARRNGAKRLYAAGVLCAMPAIALAQTVTTLHSFNGKDGSSPLAGLVQATNGDFYGTTEGGGGISTEQPLPVVQRTAGRSSKSRRAAS